MFSIDAGNPRTTDGEGSSARDAGGLENLDKGRQLEVRQVGTGAEG